MEQTFTTHSAEETKALGKKIAEKTKPGIFICLEGDLGAGKTTFTQGFLEGMGAKRPFISPTFVLMKQYELTSPTENGVKRVYHADAYRIEEKDFENLGFEEWCADQEGVVILEWPKRIQGLLPEKRIFITLQTLAENERQIVIEEK